MDENLTDEYRGGAEAYETFREILGCLLTMDEADRVEWLNDRITERQNIWKRERDESHPAIGEGTRAFRTQARLKAMESLRALIGGSQ